MAAVMQEPQDNGTPTPLQGATPLRDNVPWRSKVDDRGNTHLYKRVTAGELKVGDHLLEHIAGHKRQVATPILGIQHVADGVIVTIPDRHSNNAPVDELYAFNRPLVISKTPHLEQHDPNQNIFFQLERKDQNMEQNTLEKARDGITSAQMRINNAVENLILTVNPGLAAEAAQHVQAGATDLSNSIILGADAVAEAYVKDAFEFGHWNTRLTESAEFTQARSARLGTYEQAVSNVDLQRSASYARGALDTATQVALEQRKRGIVASMNGPLAEYAIEDARNLGMLSQPEREESGVLLAKVPPEAVLAREDGSMVAVPVPTPALRRMDVGAPVNLIADEVGVYVRNEAMEKKVENRLVQHHTLADAFLQVKDDATDKALAEARATIGEAEWKKGFTVEKRDKVREALKAHGVPLETQIAGKLDRVALAETHNGNQTHKKLRVTLENETGGKTILSTDLDKEFTQRLAAKLEVAQPGQAVTIGGFASVKEKDGRSFVDHVATLKGPDGKEIQPVKEHFKEARALSEAAIEPLKAAGLGSNQTLLTQTASAARAQHFERVVRDMESRFPEKVVQQQEKRQYPKMEGRMKTPDGTWHSVSLYVDGEGRPRGSVAVENKAQGLTERFFPNFEERVSEKTGERFLTAKMDRTDGKTLYANLMPHEKDGGDRWLSASFAERDPALPRGQQLTPIAGKGGDLKPNQALLDKADKDRTAAYLREKLKIDPVKVHELHQARKGLQPAKAGVQI